MAVIVGERYKRQGKEIDIGFLTEATEPDSVNVLGCEEVEVCFSVASIGTNVVLGLRKSFDGSNWRNVNDDDSDLTVLSNGEHTIRYTGLKTTVYIQPYWVSKSGGTPTVSCKIRLG
jgi:hypothetical protein